MPRPAIDFANVFRRAHHAGASDPVWLVLAEQAIAVLRTLGPLSATEWRSALRELRPRWPADVFSNTMAYVSIRGLAWYAPEVRLWQATPRHRIPATVPDGVTNVAWDPDRWCFKCLETGHAKDTCPRRSKP